MVSRAQAPILGHATATGTKRFAARFADRLPAEHFRAHDRLTLSSLGIGTYLGECDDADDRSYASALRAAIASGINVIDTAINYRCQRSERVVGNVIRDAIAAGDVARDEVLICTKGGYVPLDHTPPESREAYRDYVRRTYVDPGIVSFENLVGGGHSIAPAYLAHELARSRANLGVDTIDVYYLHNPEQQLDACSREEFSLRLRAAFEFLEQRVSAGDIARYGCATWNGFRVGPDEAGHLALADIVQLARDIAGDQHHFRVVQLPINLAMPEAIRRPTQAGGGAMPFISLLRAAEELGVAVVASASLLQARLASGLPPQLRDVFPGLETDAQRALAFVRSLPGVTTALVGMKSASHVAENLGAARKDSGGSPGRRVAQGAED